MNQAPRPGCSRSLVVFANGLKRVDFTWQGARDPKLWNWIHVTSPAGATAEDVAYTFYTDFGDPAATPRSDQAYQILVAAPYFRIPVETARQMKDAWQHAPAEMSDPFSVRRPTGETTTDILGLARSVVADDLALAQVPQTNQPAEAAGPAFERVLLQLEFLRDRLTPWHADGALVGALEFLSRRRGEAATDTTSAARWSAVAIAQERALHAISSDLARIFSDLASRGATPADAAGLQPVVDVLKAYAGAAGVSHFASQTTPALAAARQLAALLPLALAEDRIRQTRELVRDQQATQLDAGRVEEGARDPIASLPLLSERAAQLRAQVARGESIAPGTVARLGLDADEMSLRSRLITLTSQVRTLELRAREAGLPDERVGSDGFWTVQGVVALLRSNIRSWTEALDKAKRWTGPVDSQTSEQAATEQLRTAISTVEHRMVGFDDKLKIGEFLNWAYDQIADQQLRDAIAKIAIEIGVMIVTGQVASAGIAALRGFTLAREAMLAGEIIGEARSAGLGFAALEVVTQAGMATVTHGALGGKMGPRELAENALGIGFANIAMRPFAKLFKDAAKAEEEVRTFAQLAKRSGKMVVRGGVELGVNVGVSAAAHYVTHFDHLEIASSDTWITQGFALLAGRFVHQRTTGMHQRIEHAAKASGTRAFDALKKKVAALEARAAASTATTSPEKVSHLLEESHALLVEEKVIHERLGHADEVGAKAVERDLDAVGPEFVEVPFRLAGLKSVVDGEIYAGTAKQIDAAIASAERMGMTVEHSVDPVTKQRTLRVGDRTIVLHQDGSSGTRPKQTLDDFLGAPASKTELAQARAQAEHESATSLSDHAALVRTGHARSEREMLLAIKNGEMPRYIARVGPASSHETFANPNREFVFATEPADLRGLTPAEALHKVGWTRDWAEPNVGKEVEITILDTHAGVSLANGEAGRSHVKVGGMEWSKLKHTALADPRFVARATAEGIPEAEVAGLFDRVADSWQPEAAVSGNIEHSPKAQILLDILDSLYSVNRLYTGISSTMNEAGHLGGREVMVRPNGTELRLTADNHRKVSLGVMTRSDFHTFFSPQAQVPGGVP